MTMTAWERVSAALAGGEVDRTPVSLWRHFPNEDQSAEALADSTLAWQESLNLDFIKLMPPGDYATIDWGARSEYRGAAGGTRETVVYPIQSPEDWRHIVPVDADAGFNGEVIRACRLVRQALGDDIPILQTIFSPLTVANKLSDGLVLEHLRSHPDRVHEALGVIQDVTLEVTRQSLERGADGVFFASQCATSEMVTEDEYQEFGVRYDLPVIEAIRGAGSRFTMIHIHGDNTYFDILAGYEGHALNWHDRRVGPSIADVQARYPGRGLVAGIDEVAIGTMSASDVEAQVASAREEAGNRNLLIGPGCVIPVGTPVTNLAAAVRSARQ
jgi:uroporphyrinogen decarboxylase